MDSSSAIVEKFNTTRSNLLALVCQSQEQNRKLSTIDSRLCNGLETLSIASDAVASLQSQSIAVKALNSRINRAVPSALSLLHSFSLVDSLHRRLVSLIEDNTDTMLQPAQLLKYVDCVDRLNAAIEAVTSGCEPAVLKLQEAIEFLSRTKATDQLRIRRLRETLGAIKALYEGEVDAMKYEGLLDEALLRLQDEYECLLQQIRHNGIAEEETNVSHGSITNNEVDDELDEPEKKQIQLGSDIEVEVLERISRTLASNDCLDICIDIYVKVRYRRAAKALMRLNPRYLKTHSPEDIDNMEWEALESSITHWIDHFQLAVKSVFVSEKQFCRKVLVNIMDGAVWSECFAKIADKIIAVFFRFGEGVARSSKEPQKLFKLLDMYDFMDKISVEFTEVFDGESCEDICARFRELQKLLVHAGSKVFWEFGLRIEGLGDGAPPPRDGSVPKVVRYAVNYLKCLAGEGYCGVMGRVLRTDQMWKAGYLSRPEPEEGLLREAVWNTLDALYRNVESKRMRYVDKVLGYVLGMNAYWYMYMRTKGSDLGRLVGEETVKKKYKSAAEEAAYDYQAQAWGPLIGILEKGDGGDVRERAELFMQELTEMLRLHQSCYCIAESDLREQIKEVVVKIVVPAYNRFIDSNLGLVKARNVKEMVEEVFGEDVRKKANVDSGKLYVRRREAILYQMGGKNEDGERRGSKSVGKLEDIEGGGRVGKRIEIQKGGSFGRRKEMEEAREDVEDKNQLNNNVKFEKNETRKTRFLKTGEKEETFIQVNDGRRTMDAKRSDFVGDEYYNQNKNKKLNEEETIESRRANLDGGKRVFRKRELKNRTNGGSGSLNNGNIIEA